MRNRLTGVALSIAIVCILCGGCSLPAASPLDSKGVDVKCAAILRGMSDTLAGARSLRFKATVTSDERLTTGQVVQMTRQRELWLRRPDKLKVDSKGDQLSNVLWYDGAALTFLDRSLNVVAVEKRAGTVRQLLKHVAKTYGVVPPFAGVIAKNPYMWLTAAVKSSRYVGVGWVGRHRCHHLAFRQESVDWQIWIDAGGTAVPRKLVLTYTDDLDLPAVETVFDEWELSPKLVDDVFKARIPDDAERIELREMIGDKEGEQE